MVSDNPSSLIDGYRLAFRQHLLGGPETSTFVQEILSFDYAGTYMTKSSSCAFILRVLSYTLTATPA